MSTILFNDIIFGPIKSRRLGNSLGVNLLPRYGKWCSFDCIYCECGWNKDGKEDTKLPTREEVFEAMESRMAALKQEGTEINTITFSGNGEPTLHPDFPEIIDFTLKMREKYFPSAVVSVLSNATQIVKEEIRTALMKIDNPILKLDGATDAFVEKIDRPNSGYTVAKIVENLRHFQGNFILQTMFLKGEVDGQIIDCTSPKDVRKWVEMAISLNPREVMMYTLDRETPAQNLSKVTVEEMEEIARPLVEKGIKVQIRG